MKSKLLIAGLLFSFCSFAQVGIGTLSPDSTSMLDITTIDRGILFPRLSQTERDAIKDPAHSLMLFCTDCTPDGVYYYDTNATAWINSSSQIFELSNGVVRAGSAVNVETDDFVIGSSTLDYNGNSSENSRFFFDKSKDAFRMGNSGFAGGTFDWDEDSIGDGSVVVGSSGTVTGLEAVSIGADNTIYGEFSSALGALNKVSGAYSAGVGMLLNIQGSQASGIGFSSTVSGSQSAAVGFSNTVSGSQSAAVGGNNTVAGGSSYALGKNNELESSLSFALGRSNYIDATNGVTIGTGDSVKAENGVALGNYLVIPTVNEVVIGSYNTDYTISASGATTWDNQDRLFTVANGTSDGSRSDALIILKGGEVGIGNSTPNVALDVTGDIEYTGTITDVSDKRLKENFQPIESALDRLKVIEGLSYNMKSDPLKSREYGVIAQDVQKVFPEMVKKIEKNQNYLGVSYIQLIPVLIEALKEMEREKIKMEKDLYAENQKLQLRVEVLEKNLQKQQALKTEMAELRRLVLTQSGSR